MTTTIENKRELDRICERQPNHPQLCCRWTQVEDGILHIGMVFMGSYGKYLITMPEMDGYVGISQENSGTLNAIPGTSRVLGASNPNSVFYTGKPIERGSYDVNAGVYFNNTTGKIIHNYRTVKNIDVRRWNFNNF